MSSDLDRHAPHDLLEQAGDDLVTAAVEYLAANLAYRDAFEQWRRSVEPHPPDEPRSREELQRRDERSRLLFAVREELVAARDRVAGLDAQIEFSTDEGDDVRVYDAEHRLLGRIADQRQPPIVTRPEVRRP